MRKTIIEPRFGERVEKFDESDKVDSFVHSNGVMIDHGNYQRVHLSGMAPINDSEELVGENSVEIQTRTILENIQQYLEALGGSMDDIVRVRVYTKDMEEDDFLTIHEVRSEFFDEAHYPASTLVEVAGFVLDEMLIEIDTEAIIPTDDWEISELDVTY